MQLLLDPGGNTKIWESDLAFQPSVHTCRYGKIIMESGTETLSLAQRTLLSFNLREIMIPVLRTVLSKVMISSLGTSIKPKYIFPLFLKSHSRRYLQF